MGHNLYRQYDIQKNPQKYIGHQNEEKGRLRAVYETGKGNKQKGLARFMGGRMGTQGRANTLMMSRDFQKWLKGGSKGK